MRVVTRHFEVLSFLRQLSLGAWLCLAEKVTANLHDLRRRLDALSFFRQLSLGAFALLYQKKNATVNLHGRSLEVLSFFHQLSLGAFALLQKIISTLHGLSFLPFCGAVLENVEQLGRCLPRLAQGGEG